MLFEYLSRRLKAGTKRYFFFMMSALLVLSSSGISYAESPQRGGILKLATLALDTADPHRNTGSLSVQPYIEGLVGIAVDGSIKPFLAERYDVSEDGLTYTFYLRNNVVFHNGRKMVADDVLKNFERVRQNISKGWLAGAMKKIERMEAANEHTFTVTLKEPYVAFLNLISELWILAPESEGWDATITQPIGTGPFTFAEWQPGSKFVGLRHDKYWQKGLPYLDGVEFDLRESKDNDLAIRSGDLHVAVVSSEKVPSLRKSGDVSFQNLKDTTWYFWSFNNRNPRSPLNNVKVREAIMYAMDKPGYMNFIAGDQGIVSNQMVIPGNFYYDKALNVTDKHARANLAKAKSMLAELGVKPEEITLKVVSWQKTYPEVAVQMLKQLGFQVNHLALDDLGAQNELAKYDWDLAPMASGPRVDIYLRFVRMLSEGPNPVLWGGVQDPEYDTIVAKAIATVDDQERRKLYLQAWQRVLDNYYTVVAGHSSEIFAVRNEVKGYTTGFTWGQHGVDSGIVSAWIKKQ